jgi:O-antigen/teichoic acid export membrane protein
VRGATVSPGRTSGTAPSRSRVQLDGIALMASTAATAATSLLFWVVAARSYPAESIGVASATVNAFTMLAGFAQLNLLAVFLRFLAGSGNRALRFLSTGYSAVLVVALVFGAGYLALGLGEGFLGGAASWEYVVFVLAVPVFAVFVVQDGVLTAFAKAPWVPIENLAVALLRLALLGLLIPALVSGGDGSRAGIVAAWTVPTVLAVLVVSAAVFRRLAPAHVRRTPDASSLPPRGELLSFVAAQYVNNVVNNVVTYVPPLVVLYLLGAEAAAYFNVPWLIVVSTQTLLWNIGMSFVAEVTRRPEQIAAHTRSTLRLGGVVVLGWTGALLVGAPLLLGLQGGAFAAEGTGLLRLLALSFPFTAVVVMYSLIASLERRIWRLTVVNAVGAAALFGAMAVLVPGSGIVAVGAVYLVVQAVLALVLLPSLAVRLRRGNIRLPEYTALVEPVPVEDAAASGPDVLTPTARSTAPREPDR